jgi:hypothetical protein
MIGCDRPGELLIDNEGSRCHDHGLVNIEQIVS